MTHNIDQRSGVLTIVPTLNEGRNIARILRTLLRDRKRGLIVVADGGSEDDTRAIVTQMSRGHPQIILLDNPDRIQSAGINRAVERYGRGHRWLVRIDAHCDYPGNYVSRLLEAARQTGAQSVVVSMETDGRHGFVAGVAAAQNSPLGTGGSAHRSATQGQFVDHGHHALMQIEAFRRVGGYCENMTCNEDAELDTRLRKSGARIWLEPSARIQYHPRQNARDLFRQYFRYGKGRLMTIARHKEPMRLRQMLPPLVAPASAGLLVAPLLPFVAIPATLWLTLCVVGGLLLAYRHRKADVMAAGPAAAIMHLAWSMGFWRQFVELMVNPDNPTYAAELPFTNDNRSGT